MFPTDHVVTQRAPIGRLQKISLTVGVVVRQQKLAQLVGPRKLALSDDHLLGDHQFVECGKFDGPELGRDAWNGAQGVIPHERDGLNLSLAGARLRQKPTRSGVRMGVFDLCWIESDAFLCQGETRGDRTRDRERADAKHA